MMQLTSRMTFIFGTMQIARARKFSIKCVLSWLVLVTAKRKLQGDEGQGVGGREGGRISKEIKILCIRAGGMTITHANTG